MRKSVVIFSPEAMKRQLAGVILSRLMTRGLLELEAAQLINLSAADAENIVNACALSPETKLVSDDSPAMICIFSGEDAVIKASNIAKNVNYCFSGQLAVAPENDAVSAKLMSVLAQVTDRDNLLTAAPVEGEERTLLIIKPENFRQPSSRPGAIIDILMSLDLQWVGCKVHGMSINEALEFYGPVQQTLRKKMVEKIGIQALEAAEKEFDFKFSAQDALSFTELTGKAFADDQFEQIVEFMAGKKPSQVSEAYYSCPAGAKCMVLIFDGVDAVSKIRTLLGPTNPANAPAGTIRYDFGTDLMVNAAHASDSPESYERESAIVKVNENLLSKLVRS